MENKIMRTDRVCSDIYCRPYTYCHRRQFTPILPAHIVVLEHILLPATIYGDIDFFHRYGNNDQGRVKTVLPPGKLINPR